MGTHTNGLQSYWFSVLIVILMFYLIPVKSTVYCYYYYSYSYSGYRITCNYYYYNYYYYYSSDSSSSLSTGAIIGMSVGGVVGFIIFVSCVIGVCTQICKKKNQGRVIVHPQQANISHINTTHSTQGGLNPLYYNSQYPPPPPAYHPHVYPPNAPTFPNQTHSQIPEQAALPS